LLGGESKTKIAAVTTSTEEHPMCNGSIDDGDIEDTK
jgi:hypothetical protein